MAFMFYKLEASEAKQVLDLLSWKPDSAWTEEDSELEIRLKNFLGIEVEEEKG